LADALDSKSNDQNPQTITPAHVTTSAAGSLSLPLSVNPQNDADLAAVIDAWPTLPADVRKMIRGVVKATLEASKGRTR